LKFNQLIAFSWDFKLPFADKSFSSKEEMRAKSAFTLAEVLITLTIIGVVAAITIPNLMVRLRTIKLQSQFKEAYSLLSQAVIQFNEDDEKSTNRVGAPYLMKYFKGATLCSDHDSSTTIFCLVRTESGAVTNHDYKYTDYTKTSKYVTTTMFDDFQFFLPNGMLIINDMNKATNGDFYVSVDINGKKGKPNALGHDFFVFVLRKSEKTGGMELIPSGESTTWYSNKNSYCSKTPNRTTLNGFGCAYYAITDSEYFKNLPK
jgi:prepilin-type N-terminal cleavage/methylation domain-containing protein